MNAGMTMMPPIDPISCDQSVYFVSSEASQPTPSEKHATETGFEMSKVVHILSYENLKLGFPQRRIQVGFIPEHALVQVSKYFQHIN
jgi:hypothetical protein